MQIYLCTKYNIKIYSWAHRKFSYQLGLPRLKSLTKGSSKSNTFYKIKGIEWDELKEFDESKMEAYYVLLWNN